MMYKSQFWKIDTYDWFCGPRSHMAYLTLETVPPRYGIIPKYRMLTVYCIYGIKYLFKESDTFIQQGCITLIKSDSKDIYNVTKDFYFT